MHLAAPVIALCVLVVLSLAAFADTLTGKVVKITDGDTLYVLDANYQQHKIRLAEIDAPERKQTFGNASRKHLATLVAGKQVTVKWDKRDRYSRIVGFVIVDGQDVNLAQVRAGKAVYAGSIPTPASISLKHLPSSCGAVRWFATVLLPLTRAATRCTASVSASCIRWP